MVLLLYNKLPVEIKQMSGLSLKKTKLKRYPNNKCLYNLNYIQIMIKNHNKTLNHKNHNLSLVYIHADWKIFLQTLGRHSSLQNKGKSPYVHVRHGDQFHGLHVLPISIRFIFIFIFIFNCLILQAFLEKVCRKTQLF